MNIWQFLDRTFARFKVEHVAGAGIFLLTGVILYLAAAYPDLREDELFRVLAQAIVVQGLVGLAMAAWFTVKHRQVDEVEVVNEADHPVPTEDAE